MITDDDDLDDVSIRETAAEHLLSLNDQSYEDFLIDKIIPPLVDEKENNGNCVTSQEKSSASIEIRGLKRKSDELYEPQSINSEGINVIQLDDNRWKCNICSEAVFDTLVEACMHEVSCNPFKAVGAIPSLEDSVGCGTSSDVNNKSLGISLVPENRNILSDYNYLLTHHIEFFEVKTKYAISEGAEGFNISDLPTKKYGLRCIHCSHDGSYSSTACTFFPSTVGSIASGLGTIGARHLSAGKCAFLSASALEELLNTRKKSQQQSRHQGKVGLDQYFRDLARRFNIVDQAGGGIKIAETLQVVDQLIDRGFKELTLEKSSFLPNDEVCTTVEYRDTDTFAFIEGDIEHFWVCRHCKALPIPWRASGSVLFSATIPSMTMIEKHLSLCQGTKPLPIPRNAVVESVDDCDVSYNVRIHWNNDLSNVRKSNRLQHRSGLQEDSNNNSQVAVAKTGDIYEGVEDIPLALPADEDLTTEFAFYTVLQLKKCYLTKSGGSRGNCPLGYPGLACCHCAGSTNERRFFYTSSDHLRNSFSHIPAHILICSLCPEEVKTRMEALKCIRNKQKSLLKVGLHKIFMDRVWERLHGPGGGVIDDSLHNNFEIYDDDTAETVSQDIVSNAKNYKTDSTDCDLDLEMTSSPFIRPLDRNSTTDYTIYSLLQLILNCSVCDPNASKGTSCVVNLESEEDGMKNDYEITLSCKHCVNRPEAMSFKMNRSDDLRNAFHDISDHLLQCQYCPEEVKSKLRLFKSMRASQEANIKYATHRNFINNVWERILSLVNTPGASDDDLVNAENALVSENDRALVSDYTFFTMLQMKPCYLDRSGNGARSMFDHGFPGLACIHCADTSSPRTFFYRTAEILSGNYAHIPNHLLSCKHCPASIKSLLQEKKRVHMSQKVGLNRGSQRLFFNNVWERLHNGRR